jgi:hypothetical protein
MRIYNHDMNREVGIFTLKNGAINMLSLKPTHISGPEQKYDHGSRRGFNTKNDCAGEGQQQITALLREKMAYYFLYSIFWDVTPCSLAETTNN